MNGKKTCETCFVKCIDMDKHIRKMHTNPEDIQEPERDPVFACDQCKFFTSYSSNLKKHNRNVHEKEQIL